ncbi:MAG: type I DNA topoisomerase [Patescibacteria group bacterium]|nr:type I DNA topoisomerase [Patescibacteria group bacterium]MDE2116538.1 type I DNA topoisomerase [Patescibacteria group bacterium]
MSKLLIVESPAKAKTIGKYLGSDYTVVASIGHVRDLPKSNKKAIDMEHFTPHYEVSAGKEKVLHEIEKLAKKSDEVLLATDPDREGEAIAWHIAQAVDFHGKPVRRVVFHEITKDAIVEALGHPREIDESLRRAQEARRVLDRLVGYDLSGVIWKKVRYGLSAGRVQSPALRIIVEREREIRAFTPERYFVITAETKTGSADLSLVCSEEPKGPGAAAEAERIVKTGKENPWHVVSVEETEAKRSPRAPFTTSTLQQAASTRLGFSPARTMRIAQKLYEAGLITYMRTDSTNLSKQAVGQIAGMIERTFGKEAVHIRTFATKSKNAQEAHEAVRPTDASRHAAGSTDEEKKLYGLVWARAVASQMADARVMRTKIVANIAAAAVAAAAPKSTGTQSIPDFQANGSRTIYRGWLEADPAAQGEDVELPKVSQGDPLTIVDISSQEKFTEPPSRYSEAGLVKELEKRGIGRPSTYASIIKTLEDREYVTKENRNLRPTDTGEVVSGFLEDNFGSYISDTFTAEMEDKLDLIADGKAQYEKTLSDFYKPFAKEVKAKDKLDKATTLGEADPRFTCPICGASMIIKLGRSGKFLSCSRYPDCTGALTIEGKELPKDKVIGIHPDTGSEITLKTGKYGPYVEMVMPADEEKPEKKSKKAPKPKLRRASVPKDVKPEDVTLDQAVHYLSLPRQLGVHPETGKIISASIGRFGPYIVHDGDFRSVKAPDDVYTIALERALEILREPKKRRGFARKKTA